VIHSNLTNEFLLTRGSFERRLEVADDVILNDATTTPEQLRARALTLHDRWLALATTTGR